MRIFTCSVCQQMLFFENVQCTSCSYTLGYLPDHRLLSALERTDGADATAPVAHDTLFTALAPKAKGARYRLCRNSVDHGVCNWLVPEGDAHELCLACRLNNVIPNLDTPAALEAWHKLERAKRRLLYTLYELELPVEGREERPENGLAFAFMSDGEKPDEKVFTGHADGLITINTNEADDPFREQVRKDMGEAYRTLLGHFRHEVGHYYWDRLIKDSPFLGAYRALFGDERLSYADALQYHYEHGSPADWGLSFVSAYATMHPWEDWAETWAHYLHMVDTLGTARAYGLSLKPKPVGGSAEAQVSARSLDFDDFDDLMAGWVPLTLALNGLNRSMGLVDPYPFILSEKAITKLRFVHDVLEHWNSKERVRNKVLERWPAVSLDEPPPPSPLQNSAPADAPPAPGTEPAPPAADAPPPSGNVQTVTVEHTVQAPGATKT